MSDLNVRRAVVWVVSAILGVLLTLVVFAIIGTNFQEFGIETILVIIPFAVIFMIWLDYFLGTKILPE